MELLKKWRHTNHYHQKKRWEKYIQEILLSGSYGNQRIGLLQTGVKSILIRVWSFIIFFPIKIIVCVPPHTTKRDQGRAIGLVCVVITHVHVSFLICSVLKQFSKTWSPTSTRKTNPVNLPTTTVRRHAAAEPGSPVLKTYLGSLINWKPLSLIWNHYFFLQPGRKHIRQK